MGFCFSGVRFSNGGGVVLNGSSSLGNTGGCIEADCIWACRFLALCLAFFCTTFGLRYADSALCILRSSSRVCSSSSMWMTRLGRLLASCLFSLVRCNCSVLPEFRNAGSCRVGVGLLDADGATDALLTDVVLECVENRGKDDAAAVDCAVLELLAIPFRIDENIGAEAIALLTTVEAFVCDVDEEDEAMNAAAEVDDGVKYDVIIAVPRVAQYTFPTFTH